MAESPTVVLGNWLVDERRGRRRPLIVALDGRSGAGKSTLAAAVAADLSLEHSIEVSIIEGDDFYGGGSASFWDGLTVAENVDQVIDWRRQRATLERLLTGRTATWHPFDWEAFDGRLASRPETCEPTEIVVLEGAYSGRPELADLVDLRVLLVATAQQRRARLIEREGNDQGDGPVDDSVDQWNRRWARAEDRYFGAIMGPERFDLVIDSV